MSMEIQAASNGYLLTVYSNDGPPSLEVFETGDTQKEGCECLQRLLYTILERLDGFGSKHDEFRVRVEVVDQHPWQEYSDPDGGTRNRMPGGWI